MRNIKNYNKFHTSLEGTASQSLNAAAFCHQQFEPFPYNLQIIMKASASKSAERKELQEQQNLPRILLR